MDLGIMAEGVVELDPMTGRLVLRCERPEGGFDYIDVQAVLERYKGEEVRFIMTPFATINRLAEMVEAGEIEMGDAQVAKVRN
jgi:hypothetical protein